MSNNSVLGFFAAGDQILLGADQFYAGSGVAEQRYFHGGIVEPLVGFIENFGDTPITVSALHSSDDAATDAYAALTLRVRGANVASITIPPRASGLFLIEGFLNPLTVKKWLKFAATSRAVNGRLSLYSFGGSLSRVGAHIA
jgi:hypothetical protein